MAFWGDDICDRCGHENRGHATWCYRETMNALAAQDCPPAPKLPPEMYDDPPF